MQWNYQAAVGMQITTTSLKRTEKQSWCLCAFKQDRGSPPHSNFLRLGCGMLVSPLQPLSQKAAGRDHTYHTMNGFSRFSFFSILICCYIQGMPPSDREQRSTAFFHTKDAEAGENAENKDFKPPKPTPYFLHLQSSERANLSARADASGMKPNSP